MKAHLLGAAAAVLVNVLAGNYSYAQAQTSAAVTKSQLSVGAKYYISADSLNVRSSNSTTESNVVGKLVKNDIVEIYDVLNEATPLVQIKIIKSSNISANAAPELFVSKDYLSAKMVITESSNSKYFVIQNIATEKTRVYERCTVTPDCPHKLVMETDTVVGRPEEGTDDDPNAYKTWIGHGRISTWVKFYQDGLGFYPRWYTPGQDISTIPDPVTDSMSLLMGARKWIVKNDQGKTSNYGAFGWYAAKLSPEGEDGVNYQWIHGTMGWGKDGSKPIEITRGKMINFFSNPGSHGCTRLENRAVAFMRHLLPVGTDVYRVYAREATREVAPYSRYRNAYNRPYRWEFMLLTNGAAESNGLTADAATIRNQGVRVSSSNLIEKGIYEIAQYPTVMGLDYSKSAASGKSGDRYSIDKKNKGSTNFRGYFLVDEGRFQNYQHPSYSATNGAVRTGGLQAFRTSVPEYLTAAPGRIQVPAVSR
ncbi:L,D-transpeptidase [Bdellovibrio bacteriovorus]|uniref:L,D-transpeptidase n=1 Tax=Bdellovibrio TaxID=958 RepID=UPI0035A820E8